MIRAHGHWLAMNARLVQGTLPHAGTAHCLIMTVTVLMGYGDAIVGALTSLTVAHSVRLASSGY